jgi:hypothetical protein
VQKPSTAASSATAWTLWSDEDCILEAFSVDLDADLDV